MVDYFIKILRPIVYYVVFVVLKKTSSNTVEEIAVIFLFLIIKLQILI